MPLAMVSIGEKRKIKSLTGTEDIKKHLTGINQVDIKYLNDQLKKYSKEKNDEVVYEIFTMIYKRLDPEALQKIHSQVESVQAILA